MPALMAVALGVVAREWGRIGTIGFGGPPAHIALLRELCVERRRWMTRREFEDAIAACNLLPGPASTQLAIYCAWRVAGRAGALVGGLLHRARPGRHPRARRRCSWRRRRRPWVLGAGAGAGAAVAAVAVHAGLGLVPASWHRAPAPAGPGALGRLPRGGRSPPRSSSARGWSLVLLACGAGRAGDRRARPRPARDRAVARRWPAGRGRRAGRARLDRAEGRRAVLRRRLRHHPADAVRRGRPLPLDDRRPVPLRRRARPDHARPGGAHGGGGRLRGGRARPGALLAAVVAFAPSFVVRARRRPRFDRLRRQRAARGRSSTAPGRPRSARSSGRRRPARPALDPRGSG